MRFIFKGASHTKSGYPGTVSVTKAVSIDGHRQIKIGLQVGRRAEVSLFEAIGELKPEDAISLGIALINAATVNREAESLETIFVRDPVDAAARGNRETPK